MRISNIFLVALVPFTLASPGPQPAFDLGGDILPPIAPPTLIGLPDPVGGIIKSIVDKLETAIADLTKSGGNATDVIAILQGIVDSLKGPIPFDHVGA